MMKQQIIHKMNFQHPLIKDLSLALCLIDNKKV